MENLRQLHLDGTAIKELPSSIEHLTRLEVLNLCGCQNLVTLPESICNLCFLEALDDFECKIYLREKRFARVNLIVSGSCGIPKWISHHKKGAKVVAKLPQNWYKNNDLLGFVLYCVYDPLGNESEETLENDATYFKYGLTLRGHEIQFVDELQFYPWGRCYDVVPKMWLIYYPKVEIQQKYHSNKWRQLTASFSGRFEGKAVKVEECGIHLMYAHDLEQNHGKAMIPTICRECQGDVQSRGKLCLKGNAINELPTIGCPLELDSLCLRECKNLERLPSSICELKSLTALFCSGCSRLRSFPEILEDMENLRELHLDGTAIEELPASIRYLRGLQYLNLADCTNLVNLPESLCNLSSLKFLNVSFCTKLEKFPENLRSLQCLEDLSASGTAIEELPSSFEHLQGLQCLKLARCYSLVSLPESICNLSSLRTLDVSFCTKLEKFPENLRSLQCLKRLYASGTAIEELPSSFEHLQGLQCLKLARCDSLVSLPESIFNLSSLRTLDVSFCMKLEKFPENLRSLQCLKYLYASGLNLSMDCFSSILAGIIQLSKLRVLDLSDCQGLLLRVPELPPSLRYLDVHNLTCLETLSSPSSLLGVSLFKCFKSTIEV
ncbi:hypothetical protein PVL29_025028 [Vitis rotundifolia]|uniref:Leucine-rich repeat domain, L domain-containing protein n=1 Tax=Vitis rotundifolia TaxID=103349 RepID=A0AA38YTR1_VITRO|nr:hypothetical protein PVL29_025028 [Vitis rotundifolia]